MDQVNGNPISLKDAMGKKGLIVIFSCNTCPWVLAWEDRYNLIYKKYKDKGIDMVAINSNQGTRNSGDSMSDMVKHAKKDVDYFLSNFFIFMDSFSIKGTANKHVCKCLNSTFFFFT